jgi:carboxylesterase type B
MLKAEKSVHGEELPYVLGIPFDGPRFHFHNNYNMPEKLLSEVVMTMWGNFAKTG